MFVKHLLFMRGARVVVVAGWRGMVLGGGGVGRGEGGRGGSGGGDAAWRGGGG